MSNVTNNISKNVENVNSANVNPIESKIDSKIEKKDSKDAKPKKVIAPKQKKDSLLDELNALQISVKTEKSLSGKKSIFKKEYNSKNLRTKIRSKLYGTDNAFGLLELFLKALKEKDSKKAKEIKVQISEICKDAFIAETKFENYNQYGTDNLDSSKLNVLKSFIKFQSLIK